MIITAKTGPIFSPSVQKTAKCCSAPTSADIPALVSVFKRFVNRKIGQNIWQRSYYDHVIRGRQDYLEIWKYIDENPLRWSDDEYAKTDG